MCSPYKVKRACLAADEELSFTPDITFGIVHTLVLCYCWLRYLMLLKEKRLENPQFAGEVGKFCSCTNIDLSSI